MSTVADQLAATFKSGFRLRREKAALVIGPETGLRFAVRYAPAAVRTVVPDARRGLTL